MLLIILNEKDDGVSFNKAIPLFCTTLQHYSTNGSTSQLDGTTGDEGWRQPPITEQEFLSFAQHPIEEHFPNARIYIVEYVRVTEGSLIASRAHQVHSNGVHLIEY